MGRPTVEVRAVSLLVTVVVFCPAAVSRRSSRERTSRPRALPSAPTVCAEGTGAEVLKAWLTTVRPSPALRANWVLLRPRSANAALNWARNSASADPGLCASTLSIACQPPCLSLVVRRCSSSFTRTTANTDPGSVGLHDSFSIGRNNTVSLHTTVALLVCTVIVIIGVLTGAAAGFLARLDGASYPTVITRAIAAFTATLTLAIIAATQLVRLA